MCSSNTTAAAALLEQVQGWLLQYNVAAATVDSATAELQVQNTRLQQSAATAQLLQETKPYLDLLVQQYADTTLQQLEHFLSYGVQQVFYDRAYSVSITVTERRGLKNADVYLHEGAAKYPMQNAAVAGGVLVVVGFLLQVFYVLNLDVTKTIFLDEALSNISTQYLDRFFGILAELATATGLALVLVTHDQRFLPYAQRVYRVSEGVYTLEGAA